MSVPDLQTSTEAPLDEAARYERDGFLVFDPGIPASILDGAVESTRAILSREDRVHDAWQRAEPVRRIATWPKVLEMLRAFYGKRVRPFQTLNFAKGTEQKTHSDTIHFSSIPSGLMCGVWVALEDVDETNGPLAYYPGSHLWPEITMADLERDGYVRRGARDVLNTIGRTLHVPGFGSSPHHYPRYERYVEALLEKKGVRPRHGLVKKGQAILWSANLLHGGAPQRDKARSRHSQVTHYYVEGGVYYTPLLSQGRSIFWRSPRWIPEG